MQAFRRASLVALTLCGMAGSVNVAPAAPLQGLNAGAAAIFGTEASNLDRPKAETAYWHYYHHHHWHHRHHWHHHYWHHRHWRHHHGQGSHWW